MLYKGLLKPIFFQIDPETIHERILALGSFLGRFTPTKGIMRSLYNYSHPALHQRLLGISFSNPVGLAGGFDKDGILTDILPSLGFGFAEIGSITGEPCTGNPKPRLWRLKKSRGIVVNYGLKNEGCKKIAARLRRKTFHIPVGTNIAKTNSKKTVPLQAGIHDYAQAYRAFAKIGDYFTINISCPNTYGGQPFTHAQRLKSLLAVLQKIPTKKPRFLKLSPDLTLREIDAIIAVAQRHRIHGFICTNLTKDRNNPRLRESAIPPVGGMSGKIVEDRSNTLIRYVYQKTQGKSFIIGCGGVFSAEDAYQKIKAGASLIQLVTGMIFEGPQVISEINQGLVRRLHRDRLQHISDAIGIDVRTKNAPTEALNEKE